MRSIAISPEPAATVDGIGIKSVSRSLRAGFVGPMQPSGRAMELHCSACAGSAIGACLFIVAALLALPVPAAAKEFVLPPDSLGLKPASKPGRGAWNLFLGDASPDTLRATRRRAYRAVIETLEGDSWKIQFADSSMGRVVTCWKPLHHILVRLFAGKVLARCFVNVASLGNDGSIVTMQGGLATRHPLEGNPILPFALKSYRKEAKKWHGEVRENIGLRSVLADAKPAGSVSSADPPKRKQRNGVK